MERPADRGRSIALSDSRSTSGTGRNTELGAKDGGDAAVGALERDCRLRVKGPPSSLSRRSSSDSVSSGSSHVVVLQSTLARSSGSSLDHGSLVPSAAFWTPSASPSPSRSPSPGPPVRPQRSPARKTEELPRSGSVAVLRRQRSWLADDSSSLGSPHMLQHSEPSSGATSTAVSTVPLTLAPAARPLLASLHPHLPPLSSFGAQTTANEPLATPPDGSSPPRQSSGADLALENLVAAPATPRSRIRKKSLNAVAKLQFLSPERFKSAPPPNAATPEPYHVDHTPLLYLGNPEAGGGTLLQRSPDTGDNGLHADAASSTAPSFSFAPLPRAVDLGDAQAAAASRHTAHSPLLDSHKESAPAATSTASSWSPTRRHVLRRARSFGGILQPRRIIASDAKSQSTSSISGDVHRSLSFSRPQMSNGDKASLPRSHSSSFAFRVAPSLEQSDLDVSNVHAPAAPLKESPSSQGRSSTSSRSLKHRMDSAGIPLSCTSSSHSRAVDMTCSTVSGSPTSAPQLPSIEATSGNLGLSFSDISSPLKRQNVLGAQSVADPQLLTNMQLQHSQPVLPLRKGSLGHQRTDSSSSLRLRDSPIAAFHSDADTRNAAALLDNVMHSHKRENVAEVLASSEEKLHKTALALFLSQLDFKELAIDVALRKLLSLIPLPAETQQISRLMEAFGLAYWRDNDFAFDSSDEVFFLAFSLIMLNTDHFNVANRQKMGRSDYVRNAHMEGTPQILLEYCYDNTTFTPFVFKPASSLAGDRTGAESDSGSGLSILSSLSTRDKTRIDPYTLIASNRISELRVKQDVIPQKNPFSFTGTVASFSASEVRQSFVSAVTVQVSLAAGGPPAGTLRVARCGYVGCKEDLVDGRKTGNRKWRTSFAILTLSQLILLPDEGWTTLLQDRLQDVLGAVHPVSIAPFQPSTVIWLDNSIAVVDHSYRKKENCFRLQSNGRQYLIQASDETDQNGWIQAINWAASIRSHCTRAAAVHVNRQKPGSALIDVETMQFADIMQSELHTKNVSMLPSRLMSMHKLKNHLEEIESSICQAKDELHAVLRLTRRLGGLTPFKNSTREKLLHAMEEYAGQVRSARMALAKLVCYREVLSRELLIQERICSSVQ